MWRVLWNESKRTVIPVDCPSELALWDLGLSGMFARWISPGSVRLTVLLWLFTVSVTLGSASELKVRVRLADGQITDELLEADSEKDSITVEFKQGDGTLITFVADFKQVSWKLYGHDEYLWLFNLIVTWCHRSWSCNIFLDIF